MDFGDEHKREIPEPDLVPIMDALTAIIFFLLLSATFLELTKVTIPPSSTSTISSPVAPPPVAAHIYVKPDGENLLISLQWAGSNPGTIKGRVARLGTESAKPLLELEAEVKRIVSEFVKKYPAEKTLQVTLGADANYQEMISVMDGARHHLEDLVLSSYSDIALMH